MTRQSLLNASIQDYQETTGNVTVYDTKRIANSQGFIIIVLQNKRKLDASLHIRNAYSLDDEFSKVQEIRALLNTREKIDSQSVILYNNLYFFIDRQDDFNKVMGQYHYELLASYGYINNKFIIIDESDLIQEDINTNSYPFIYDYLSDYPVYPKSFITVFAYAPTQENYKYILLESYNTKPQSLVNNIQDGYISINNIDDIKLYCVNFNQKEVLNLTYELTQTKAHYKNVGLLSTPKIEQVDKYIKEMGVKALNHCISFTINYTLKQEKSSISNKIKHVLYNMLSQS